MTEKRVATIYDYARFLKKECTEITCMNCPISNFQNGEDVPCDDLITCHTDKCNEIILKWVDEHPIKTYKDDFLEKFPKALQREEHYPRACRQNIYGGDCSYEQCKTCWYQPYEESEDEE